MRKLLCLFSLINAVLPACVSHDVETVLGGQPNFHSVNSIHFDVEPSSLDMVVGADISLGLGWFPMPAAMIYYVDEYTCSV